KVKNNIGLSSKISRMNKVIQAKGAQKQFRIYYEHFKELIKPAGVPIMNRRSPGKDIHGACGMLALRG
ncbi:MAG TPA: 23S rRNA (adenine(2503)-C(2))-methyltransferase RlmN, partial [Leptospiraceae bacterium]|nr:23S rRNA (adenine(2503)-C(2))-methyltransferase RlmN [Leptospiraceae bacterium]